MDHDLSGRHAVAAGIERELELIRSAIEMVATGLAPRVQVAGLAFGEQLLRPARRMAMGRGVRIVPGWTADEAGASLAVEALDHG